MTTKTTSRTIKGTSKNDFWLMFTLFITFRGLTLLLLRPGGFIRDWSDFDTYLGIAALADYGLYPYLDFWLEWPPIIPWLFVGAYKLSLWLAPWEDARLWFITILGSLFLLFEGGNFYLIYRLAQKLWGDTSTINRILGLYALLFPPVYAMLGFFDGVALFFILLGLTLILRGKLAQAGVVGAIGFVVKLTPVLMAGVAARYIWQKYRHSYRDVLLMAGKYGVIFGGVVVLLLAPFWRTEPQWLSAALRATAGRSSWETLWAVLEGYYGFGQVLGDRLNSAETTFAIHPTTLPWGLISIGFGTLYTAIFFKWLNTNTPRSLISFGGVTITLFLLYSKGYSPQFLVYVLPFIVLLLPNAAGVSYALLLTFLNILEQPLYFVMLPSETWLLTIVVTARFILFICLTLEFTLQAQPNVESVENSDATPPPWLTYLRGGLIVVTLVGLVWLLPTSLKAYQNNRLQQNPYQPFILFLESQATHTPDTTHTLLLTEQPVYRQVYPHLHDDYTVILAGGDALYAGASSVTDLVAGQENVWLWASGPQGENVIQMLTDLKSPDVTYRLEGVGNLSWYNLTGNQSPPAPLAQTENGLELINYHLAEVTSTLQLTLFWEATQPLTRDYTVFTQLLNTDGQLITSHDSWPQDGLTPTSSWLPQTLIVDKHTLILPPNFNEKDYQLITGMYDSTGTRLIFVASIDDSDNHDDNEEITQTSDYILLNTIPHR